MAPSYRPYAAGEQGRSDGGKAAWWVGDAEMKRRRRVASYKVYAVEGKVKASIRRGVRWIKAKCLRIVHL